MTFRIEPDLLRNPFIRRPARILGLMALLCESPACVPDQGKGDGSTGASETNSSSGVPTTSETPTTTATSGDTTSETTAATTSATGEDADSAVADWCEQTAILQACELDDPCLVTSVDSCQFGDCDDPQMQCMWPFMRDNTMTRLLFRDAGHDCQPSGVWILVGDPERSVLTTIQEGPQDAPVVRCKLSPPAFFADCIADPTQEDCFIPGLWIEDCVPEPAPMCP